MKNGLVEIREKGKHEVINFNNVAKINLQYPDRIVINFNHSITRNSSQTEDSDIKTFSGYYYIWKDSTENYNEIIDLMYSEEFAKIFAQIKSNQTCIGFVNVNEISSIKFYDRTKNVIFNLSNTVTPMNDRESKLVSTESTISSFRDTEAFEDYVEHFKETYLL